MMLSVYVGSCVIKSSGYDCWFLVLFFFEALSADFFLTFLGLSFDSL